MRLDSLVIRRGTAGLQVRSYRHAATIEGHEAWGWLEAQASAATRLLVRLDCVEFRERFACSSRRLVTLLAEPDPAI